MLLAARAKDILRNLYQQSVELLTLEREKATLRKKAQYLPLSPTYPFDAEIKFLRYLPVKSPMLDIGANTGIYSALLEDVIGQDNLYIFEPLPHLQRLLKYKFKRAHVLDLALSDKVGAQKIRIPIISGKRVPTRASLNDHKEPEQTGFDIKTIRVSTLDDIIRKLGLKSIGFIKIDVEGHELEVLKGGMETLTRFKPIVLIEIEARHHLFPVSNIFSILENIGYKGFYLNPSDYQILAVDQFDADRDQKLKDLKSGNRFRYRNNFFFVSTTFAHNFVSQANAFLELEKSSVGSGWRHSRMTPK